MRGMHMVRTGRVDTFYHSFEYMPFYKLGPNVAKNSPCSVAFFLKFGLTVCAKALRYSSSLMSAWQPTGRSNEVAIVMPFFLKQTPKKCL